MTANVFSKIAWSALIAGTAVTGAQLSRLVWAVLDTDPAPPALLVEPLPASTGDNIDNQLAPLISAAPFGTSSPNWDAGRPASPMTDQLTLHAVRLSDDPAGSTATLSISGGTMDIYRTGQEIGGLGVIQAIEARQVIVEIAGDEIPVPFPVPDLRAPLPPLYAAMAAQYGSAPPTRRNDLEVTSRTVAESVRTQMDTDPKVLIESFGLGRSQDGYIVGSDTPPILLAAGLRPGDLIVKVNGSRVGDAASDRQLFEQAVGTGRARVEVLRDGQTLVLTFPLK